MDKEPGGPDFSKCPNVNLGRILRDHSQDYALTEEVGSIDRLWVGWILGVAPISKSYVLFENEDGFWWYEEFDDGGAAESRFNEFANEIEKEQEK